MLLSRLVRSGEDKVRRRSEIGLNGALSTPGYLLALLRELSQCQHPECPRALTEIIMPKQVRKTNLDMFLVPVPKKGWKIDRDLESSGRHFAKFLSQRPGYRWMSRNRVDNRQKSSTEKGYTAARRNMYAPSTWTLIPNCGIYWQHCNFKCWRYTCLLELKLC